MKRLLALLLVIGALSGLFGAQMAAAHSVPQAADAPLAKGMDADCMAMMAKQRPAPREKPCKGLTLDCIAAMGCVIPLVATDLAGSVETPRLSDAPSFWTTHSILTGKSFAPDPDPPTSLA
ncbi:hypothetical protein CAF53_24740 [Sphingobium sp. LB126]|uniref:hypothetical protein n=1 Tax=Sphingobium sp. LB126 TaxID=1983755 RepID=UPI000C1FF5E4|nr:hypothetical protein [Sphingobium sp. LB126]PJG45269.1 hypothetical protein CAF53_24740 [Sphingobium sp. LB126]